MFHFSMILAIFTKRNKKAYRVRLGCHHCYFTLYCITSMCLISGIMCAVLSAPSNGAVSTGKQEAPYGTVATFTCSPGFTLNGNDKRTCTGSGPRGTWTGSQPSCNGNKHTVHINIYFIFSGPHRF